MSQVEAKLAELGLSLPSPPAPVASYVPAVRSGKLLLVSGQLPMKDGKLLCEGSVPSRVSVESAQAAARQCILNALAIVKRELNGDWSGLSRIVRVGVFVQSDAGNGDQPKIANGASDLLVELLGDTGRHARAAVGTSALPLNAPVEVELTVELK